MPPIDLYFYFIIFLSLIVLYFLVSSYIFVLKIMGIGREYRLQVNLPLGKCSFQLTFDLSSLHRPTPRERLIPFINKGYYPLFVE